MLLNPLSPRTILRNNLLLFAFVTLLFLLNFYSKTLFFRPSSIHQWRQTDCLSFTKNYYEEGMHFFQPKIHFQGVKDGKTVSECPLLNYTVAGLWKVFGEYEFIYRLLEYLIYLFAVFVLFNTLLVFYGSSLLSFFITGLFLTSPLLTYYCMNFIADVPALSFCVLCYCYFFRFYHTKIQKHFYLSLLYGTLAVLLKASSVTGLAILLFFSLVDLAGLNRFFKTEKLFTKKLLPVVTIVLSLGSIISWYEYAMYYNTYKENAVFLLTVLPIWEMTESEIIMNLKILFNHWFPVFLNKPTFFLFFCCVIYVSTGFKTLSGFLKYSFVISGAIFILYLLFFFQVFNVHDYYLVNLMIFPVITLFCVAHLFTASNFVANHKPLVRLFVICFLLFNSLFAAGIYRLRTIEDDKLVSWLPFISREEMEYAKNFFWSYHRGVGALENITPELRKVGIHREDITICVPDASAEVSLYLMDQKGYMISRHDFEKDCTVVHRRYDRTGTKYLVISDTSIEHATAFKMLVPEITPLFASGHVAVYKFKTPL